MKKILKRAALVLSSTLAVLVLFAVSVLIILNFGPSPTAHKVFIKSCMETSAMGPLARLLTTDEELEKILKENTIEEIDDTTDTNLIHITVDNGNKDESPAEDTNKNPSSQGSAGTVKDEVEEGYVAGFDDGYSYKKVISNEDGILICEVSGATYRGHMMIVRDPSRVFVGCCNNIGNKNGQGEKLQTMITKYGATAGINAGGFADEGGHGSGSVPLGFVFSQGELKYHDSASSLLIGFDNNNILHVGNMTDKTATDKNIRDAVTFGPALIVNGKAAAMSGSGSGLNPRTAIGQRKDGAVLLLVIDGRQANSLGASFKDLIDIFVSFGAVNAANLDGGSSSLMIYKDKEISERANLINNRYLPTCILVK